MDKDKMNRTVQMKGEFHLGWAIKYTAPKSTK